jgi:hypothetical protein
MINYPHTNKQWTQLNTGDSVGDIYSSFNIDLTENDGKVRLGKRLVLNTGTVDDSNMGIPVAFKNFVNTGGSPRTFALAGSNLWLSLATTGYPSSGVFTKVTAGSAPIGATSITSDMDILNATLYVSQSVQDVYYSTDGTNWSSFTPAVGGAGFTHMLCNYAGRMYMTDGGNTIISWNPARTVVTPSAVPNTIPYTLNLNAYPNLIITFIKAASNKIWIGTIDQYGGKGYIFEWSTVTNTEPDKFYRLESAGALSCVIKDDVPYVMDVNGNLLVWNGGTFKKLAGLYRKNNKMLYKALASVNSRFVHPNGMSLVKGKINIVIDGRNYDNSTDINTTIEETIPSGVWEYDETKGLYHKHSFGLSKSTDTITDYGQIKTVGVGAIAELNVPSTDSGRNGTFFCGASYYADNSTIKYGIFYDDSNDTLQKAGSLILSKADADDGTPYKLGSIQNMFQNVYTLYRKFLNTNDKIVLKYRTSDIEQVEVAITWTSTTTFTVNENDITMATYWTVGTGGEVEILSGIGAGKCSHITNAVQAGGLWTVTVDETYTGASTQTARARFQTWKKISVMSTTSQATFDQAAIQELSNWVQIKIHMLFTGKDELEKLIIINENYNPAN